MPATPKASDAPQQQTAPTGTTAYRYIGTHAVNVHMTDGTLPQLGPGDYLYMGPADMALSANVAIVPYLIDATDFDTANPGGIPLPGGTAAQEAVGDESAKTAAPQVEAKTDTTTE